MNVGQNLLALALTIIAKQKVSYYEFLGRITNAAGDRVDTFADPRDICGSFQPINTNYYAQLGLDFTKSYVMWYDPTAATKELTRGTTGDKISFGGATFQVLSANDWKNVDGWVGVMLVRIP